MAILLLSLVNYQLSLPTLQLSLVNYQLSLPTLQLSLVNYQRRPVVLAHPLAYTQP